MLVSFTMTDVTAAHRPLPEPLGHGLGIQIAPALRNVAFVFAFVVDHRFLILSTISDAAGHIGRLHAGVGDPDPRMVVPDPTVVNTAQTVVRIFVLQDLEEPVPVVHLFVAAMVLGPIRHKVEFVGQRPPDVSVGREPSDAISQVAVILRVVHVGKSPAVVGVPEDHVGFDAQPLEVQDALLEALPKRRIRPVEVKLAVRVLLESEELRFVFVVSVCDREHAETNLVEG